MKLEWKRMHHRNGDRYQLWGDGKLLATVEPDGDGGLEANIWNPGEVVPDRYSAFDGGYTLARVQRIVEREVAQ